MAKITNSLHIVDEVTFNYSPATASVFNVSIFLAKSGVILVDSGMPGSEKKIESYMRKIDLELSDIKKIVLTHLDNDHIGSAPEIRKQTNAEITMHQLDSKLVRDKSVGIVQLKKLFPGYKNDEVERLLEKMNFTRDIDLAVDHEIRDEKVQISLDEVQLDIIHTPGHTPGHSCVYSRADSVLVSGDSLSVKDNRVEDPVPMYTVSISTARESIRRMLAPLEFQRLVSYHDLPLLEAASTRLREYVRQTR
jgi:glyoxylase-like metal-dependent hydrolase (beta-lactamase superfamily II)